MKIIDKIFLLTLSIISINTMAQESSKEFATTEEVESARPFTEKIKMTPPIRSFNSFSEAGLETSMSRVYLGNHFRYDSVERHRLGNEFGDYANNNFLTSLETENE